jgi:acyl carrier protein
MSTPRARILKELSDLLERPVSTSSPLSEGRQEWDSLCVVVTIGVIDDTTGKQVDGAALMACQTVGDVLKLAGVE